MMKCDELFRVRQGSRRASAGRRLQTRRRKLLASVTIWSLTLLVQAGSVFAPSHASAQGGFDEQVVAKFYGSKAVKIVVGLGAGGSYDITARAISRSLSKHIPGNPVVIVENLPGAG